MYKGNKLLSERLLVFIQLICWYYFQECGYCREPIRFKYLEARTHNGCASELACSIPECPQRFAAAY